MADGSDIIQILSGIPVLLALLSLLAIQTVPVGSIIGFFLFFVIAWGMIQYSGVPKTWGKLIGAWSIGAYGSAFIFTMGALILSGTFDPTIYLILVLVFAIPALMGYLLVNHITINSSYIRP